jgi:peptidoglycan/xylan/chitin deacetylase (PgdA/CDA1 family)
MHRFLFLVLVAVVAAHISAQSPAQRFVAIAFHDIVDPGDESNTNAVSSAVLTQFFDYLKRTGWTVVSLDDLSAAARGVKPLPPQSILITFDDGYRSLYTHLFPLLKVYRYPVQAALVGRWMEPAPEGDVRYGKQTIPRERFISWAEAREMQDSGLVEFISHSDDLHRALVANPQGSEVPAAIVRRYDPITRAYENDEQYRARIRSDLQRSRDVMTAHLGRRPRALAWPFGRYTRPALDIAREAGFSFALTLEPEPSFTSDLYAIHRFYPTRNNTLGDLVRNLMFEPPMPATRRIACVALDELAAESGPAGQEAALGTLIENLRALGANTVIVDAHAATTSGAPLSAVYFPTSLRPLRTDLLSRVSWQLRTRGGSEVFLHLPLEPAIAAVGESRIPDLFADLVRHVPSDGVAIDMRAPAGATVVADLPGEIRARRTALDISTLDARTQLGVSAYRAVAAIDPRLRLMILTDDVRQVPDWADVTVLSPRKDAAQTAAVAGRLRAGGWLRPDAAGRIALSLPQNPDQQIKALRQAQRLGASAFAACPGPTALPAPAGLAAAFSAAVYPHRP